MAVARRCAKEGEAAEVDCRSCSSTSHVWWAIPRQRRRLTSRGEHVPNNFARLILLEFPCSANLQSVDAIGRISVVLACMSNLAQVCPLHVSSEIDAMAGRMPESPRRERGPQGVAGLPITESGR